MYPLLKFRRHLVASLIRCQYDNPNPFNHPNSSISNVSEGGNGGGLGLWFLVLTILLCNGLGNGFLFFRVFEKGDEGNDKGWCNRGVLDTSCDCNNCTSNIFLKCSLPPRIFSVEDFHWPRWYFFFCLIIWWFLGFLYDFFLMSSNTSKGGGDKCNVFSSVCMPVDTVPVLFIHAALTGGGLTIG